MNVREKDILEELDVNGRMFIRIGVPEMGYQAQDMVSDRIV
jgi:hypothetical protein